MNDSTNPPADANANVAAQNQTAAASAGPLDAAAGIQSGAALSESQGASPVGGSATQGTNNPTLNVTSGVVDTNAVIVTPTTAADISKQANDAAQPIAAQLLETPPGDTSPEEELLAVLRAWRMAAVTRFDHLLNGMANSTAETLRYIAEAELHLADHISQQKTANQ